MSIYGIHEFICYVRILVQRIVLEWDYHLAWCFTTRRKAMNNKTRDYPILEEIKAGWAARGDGWAVHAPTKEAVIQKYNEREKYYEWLDQQPFIYEAAQQGINQQHG
jgi:hypothetical protein